MSAECTPAGYVTRLIAYGLDGMTGSVQTVPEGAQGVGHELAAIAAPAPKHANKRRLPSPGWEVPR
jgi:hypothetical protein